LNREKNARR
jgi:hypothetical protein